MKRSALLLAVVISGATACQNMPWQQRSAPPPTAAAPGEAAYETPPPPEPGLQLATDQRFSDVPLPVGAREDLEKSFVYESSTLQIGRMVYTSKASVNDLSGFYIRECPASGWELRNVVQAAGAELTFTKPGKRLTVNIRDLGVGMGGRQLVLTLVPDEGA